MARDCATCRHRVRRLRRQYCTRALAGTPAEGLRDVLTLMPETWQEREMGRWVSLVFRECGRDGRYWRAR